MLLSIFVYVGVCIVGALYTCYISSHIAGGYGDIYHSGGYYIGSGYYNDVLEYDEEEQAWKKIGEMTLKRTQHAVSVINYNSIKDYCT